MKVLCTVGCVNTVAPVPALADFREKKSCWVKFFLMKAGAQDEGRAREHLGGLNALGLACRRAETL